MYPSKLTETLEFFDTLTDQNDRVNVLLDYAKKFREVPAEIAVRPFDKTHLVPHCESEAYVWGMKQDDGTLKYYFAVENPSGISAKALAAILDETLSGERPEAIAMVNAEIVYRIFRQNISMGKGLGLMSTVQAVISMAQQQLHTNSAQ